MNPLPPTSKQFGFIASEIAKLAVRREELITQAFDVLECSHPSLSQALLLYLGSKRRASHWLCTPRSAWGRRTPCEMLADGDVESLWDLLQDPDSSMSHQSHA